MRDFTVNSADSADSADDMKKTVYREISREYTRSRHSPLMKHLHYLHYLHYCNGAKVTA